MNRLFNILADIFYLYKYHLMNIKAWILAAIKFLLFIHYFSCGWIYIYMLKTEANKPTVEFSVTMIDILDKDSVNYHNWQAVYVDSFYLITATISTVGYGDFKAYINDTGSWAEEMIYLYFVSVCGIALFSTVTNEIFTYNKLVTVTGMIKKKTSEIEYFLWQVSKKVAGSLPDDMFI